MLIFLSLTVYSLWTLSFSLGKIALESSSPIFLTAFRMGLAGILIFLYLALRNPSQLKISKSHFLPLTIFSILAVYLTNVFEFWGLQYLSPAKACCLYSLSPFFTMLFSYAHFNEKITWQKGLGLIIALIAMIPVLHLQSGAENLFRVSSYFSWPDLSLIAAVLCSTYGWILLRLMVKNHNMPPLTVNGWSMLIGGCFALIHSFFFDLWHPFPVVTESASSFLLSVLIMTCISNLVCYNLYSYLLTKLTATFLSFAGLLSPIFTSISSYFILGTPLSYEILLSTGMMLLAMRLVYASELSKGYIRA